MIVKTSIDVNYKFKDGWHVFQAPEMPGFYVASKDAEKAFKDVTPSLKAAVKLTFGVDCQVEQEMTFEEFKRSITPKKKEQSFVSGLFEMSNRRFLICAPA